LSKKQLVLIGGAVAGVVTAVLLLGPFDVRYGVAALSVLGAGLALYVVRALRRIGQRTATTVRSVRGLHQVLKNHETHLEGTVAALSNLVSQDRFELVSVLEAQAKAVEAVSTQLSQLEQNLRKTAVAEDVKRVSKDVARLGKALAAAQERSAGAIKAAERDSVAQVEALLDLRKLLDPRAAMPPTAEWSVPPATLVRLVETVLERQPSVVVACGGGVAPLWIGYALEKLGRGRCIVLEHDATAAEATREALEEHGLASIVEVRDARLLPLEISGESFRWYDLVSLEEIRDVDLVFVDGPRESGRRASKFPAVPVLKRMLDERGALVLLAGANAPAVESVQQRWCEEFGATVVRESPMGAGWTALAVAAR
jgi:hypothetical protein